jgi:hypothetical protein
LQDFAQQILEIVVGWDAGLGKRFFLVFVGPKKKMTSAMNGSFRGTSYACPNKILIRITRASQAAKLAHHFPAAQNQRNPSSEQPSSVAPEHPNT